LSPIISKVFENCVIFLYGNYLKSNSRQFGFKENLGCTDAIYCVRSVIDYFVENDTTVNICCLDISKAFDRLSHRCLLYKLLRVNVPLCVVNVLSDWYSKLYSCVRWGGTVSEEFSIKCGVRQGGVLSPLLFSIYVGNILNKLSKYGCTINGISYGSIMYADDVILQSSSLNELQAMVNLCCKVVKLINLQFNVKKSTCIRVGRQCFKPCKAIMTSNGAISWVNEVNYLGVTIVLTIKNLDCRLTSASVNFTHSLMLYTQSLDTYLTQV